MRGKGGPFQIETLTVDQPRADEVLVRIVATGMCHTDIVIRDQVYPVPLPIVLGHEGAGIIERVGSAVRKVIPGDHVVLSFMSCGHCTRCAMGQPAYCERGHPLCFGGTREDGSTASRDSRSEPVHDHFFGQSSFGTYALANERTVVKVPKDLPLERLGPLGCGIQTGAGSVMNALKIGTGASFTAFGSGSVGLSAVMAARIVGATTIIAVDVVASRLALAKELGATHTVNLLTPIQFLKFAGSPMAELILRWSRRAARRSSARQSMCLARAVLAALLAPLRSGRPRVSTWVR